MKAAEPTRYPDTSAVHASAADRWRALVQERRAEMERLSPDRATLGPRFWDARAHRFAARLTVDNAARDPSPGMLRILRREVAARKLRAG